MQISVTDYDIIRIVTNDKDLCQNWKGFARSLSLEEDMESLQLKYYQYNPIEEICLCMLEKWQVKTEAQIVDLLNVLEDLGYINCRDEIQNFVSQVEVSLAHDIDYRNVKSYKKIEIQSDKTGYSYQNIFGEYFDSSVTCAVIHDPHLQSTSQLNNLNIFLNVLLNGCPNILRIYLTTSFDDRKDKGHIRKLQMETLAALTTKMKNFPKKPVHLVITYDQNLYLQRRRIELDNGWSFILENGLDFYYSVDESTERWEKDLTAQA